MQDKTVIELKDVTKIYKLYKNDRARLFSIFSKRVPFVKKVAVNHVSFSIKRGEAVAILGKNGAGKSTILKMITGVAFPTKGEIIVNGRVSALLELTAGFDMEMTGRENIYLKARLMGLHKKEIQELEDAIIAFGELEEYIDQPVRTYSSGMKARLGFAINISIHPEILIVDETLSVGDADFKEKCLKSVHNLIASEDTTMLFVTHSTPIAKQFCERGIVLKKGKLICDSDIDTAINEYDISLDSTIKLEE